MYFFIAAEHLNEKFDKSQFKPALVSTNKSITFKSSPAPLTQSKSNELGKLLIALKQL